MFPILYFYSLPKPTCQMTCEKIYILQALHFFTHLHVTARFGKVNFFWREFDVQPMCYYWRPPNFIKCELKTLS